MLIPGVIVFVFFQYRQMSFDRNGRFPKLEKKLHSEFREMSKGGGSKFVQKKF